MPWYTASVALILLSGILWGVWEAVTVLRQVDRNLAASVTLLANIDSKLDEPAAYAKVIAAEIDRVQRGRP